MQPDSRQPDSRFDAVFFDFYGTLAVGDHAAVAAVANRVITDCQLAMSIDALMLKWGNAFFDDLTHANDGAFRPLHEIEARSLVATLAPLVGEVDPRPYVDEVIAYWQAPSPAPNLLAALDAITLPKCIVSNADTEDLHRAIAHLRIPITNVVSSEDARSYKPDPVIFRAALDQMGAEPNRVLHVGDSLHSDIEGAAALGLQTCWVHYPDRLHDIGKLKPDFTIQDLADIPAILNGSTRV